MKFCLIFCVLALLSIQDSFAQQGLKATVELSPAGSFEVTSSRIRGSAKATGDGYTADQLRVAVNSLVTGNEMRDQHLQEKLKADGNVIVTNAVGKGGKGTATLEMAGVKKPIEFSYKVQGKNLETDFKVNLKDFGISGINYMGVGVKDSVSIKANIPVSQ